jgi:diadenosine tetraphosphate (Ap4A) HIT family hydrolase
VYGLLILLLLYLSPPPPDTDHAAKMHELPDEYLADAMPVAKKIALALGAENYNVLQVSQP